MELDKVRQGLDILIHRGDVVALLRDDGEIGYWPADRLTPDQWAQRLSVEEIRKLRQSQAQTTKLQ